METEAVQKQKYSPIGLFLAFFIAGLIPTISLAAVGRTIGEAGVTASGEATYAIPISVPPGINGLTPQLALTYGHRQKEGIAGVGWNVSGLSAVTRCNQTFAQDGFSRTVVLSTADRFCVDGNQLRLTSGSYGTSGSKYRSEIDTIARYTANGTAGNGPAYFTVEDKNGLVYEYGGTSDSRIESLASGWTTTAITWALSRIKDRQGNEISFAYTEDGAPYGAHRIDAITYRSNSSQGVAAGYSINFVYEAQPAADVDTQYAAGGLVQDIQRLTTVNVWYTGSSLDVLVRRYQLTYEGSLSSASRSRLASVQECAGSPLKCLTPSTFTYQNGTNGLSSEVSSGSTIPAGTKALPIDLNGDGRTDLVYPSSSGSGTWYYRLANSSGGYGSPVNSGIANTNHAQAVLIDYNSDGLDDILVPYSGTTWWVIQGSIGGLVAPINTNVPVTSDIGNATALDYNGDGREDLVYAENVGTLNATIWVRYRQVSGGFATTPTLIVQYGTGFTLQGPVFDSPFNQIRTNHFDANGDGIADIAVRVRERYKTGRGQPLTFFYTTDVILGAGAGSFAVAYDAYPMQSGLPIDINGDGYSDIAYDVGNGSLQYRLSTGKSFGSIASIGPSITNLDMTKAVAMDWDGDGYQDLVLPNTVTNTWHLMRSLGNSFAAATNLGIGTAGAIAAFRVDANGDGQDDLGYVKSSGLYAHRPHAGVKPDLLQSATDGNGNSTTFNYEPITGNSYTKYADAAAPEQDYTGPIYVVSSSVQSTGAGSGTYTLTYTYHGARLNIEGRGVAGFDKKVTTDSRNGIVDTEFFRRDFPYRGRLYKRELAQASGTLIRQNLYTWASLTGGSGFQLYQFPYIQQTVEKNYEVGGIYNGLQFNEISTTSVVDGYGTPTSITTVTSELSSGNGVQAGATFTQQLLNTGIINNTTSWCLGRPAQTQLVSSHNQAYGSQITRTVTRSWETSTYCRLTQEVVEPASPTYKVTRSVAYDGFGNVNSETVTGVGMTARTTTTNWGATGQFPLSVTNPMGQTSSSSWDSVKGVQLSQTDANGLSVSWLHDDFGRLIRQTNVDGTHTDYTLTSCTSGNSYCGTSYNRMVTRVGASFKATNGSVMRSDYSYLDKLDRLVQTARQQMGGARSKIRTIYDDLGRVSQQSAPDFSGTPTYYGTTVYDLLGRPIQASRPINDGTSGLQYTYFAYDGLTTTTTDAEGKVSKKIVDALGRTVRSVDQAGYYQQFDYDSFGSIRRVRDSLGNNLLQNTYAYGVQAHRLTSDDMDMGLWTYTPNALGENVGHTDAKGQNFAATFDQLGRPVTRTEPGNSTTWTWGASAAAHNIGRLASVVNTGHSESYTYDSKGRISRRTSVADVSYQTDFSYDSVSGQLDTLTYPTSTSGYRLKLKYSYQNGVLSGISDFNAPATVFWTANSVDARGNVVHDTLGNGVQTVRGFDAVTGYTDFIQSGPSGTTSLQNMEFAWNRVGSLTQRKDMNRSLTEDFNYDNLHRLASSTLNGVQNLANSYDAMGNITYKSDVGAGTWSYHATKKHAVTSAAGNSFSYDANGNQITRNGDAISWTSYNYPSHISNGSKYHDYYYGANRQRWKQVYFTGSTSETTIFVDNILEKHTAGSLTEYRHYIKVGSQAVALYTRPSSGSPTTQYFLLDHLGSVAEITNSAGSVDVSESFSAFGQRRDPTDWSGPISSGDESTIGSITPRGYTFHTNLESSSLIHMNGRVADSLTGRFLSPDPYVPHPEVTQSFNRYSYVRNNPLTLSDPSGFWDVAPPPPCWSPSCLIVNTIFNSIAAYAVDWIRGGSDEPKIPNGCWVQANGCYGRAGSLKLAQVATDVVKTPGAALETAARGSVTYEYGDGLEWVRLAIEHYKPQQFVELPLGQHVVKVTLSKESLKNENGDPTDMQVVKGDGLEILVDPRFYTNQAELYQGRVASRVLHEMNHINDKLRGIDIHGDKLSRAKSEVNGYYQETQHFKDFDLSSDGDFRIDTRLNMDQFKRLVKELEKESRL